MRISPTQIRNLEELEKNGGELLVIDRDVLRAFRELEYKGLVEIEARWTGHYVKLLWQTRR